MAFQVSPGVNVTEIDLTTIVPAVSTTVGAIAGNFNWGPVGQRILLSSETDLINNYGRPTSNNQETWFTAANFLNYGNALYVVRSASANSAKNASASANGATSSLYIKNLDDYNKQSNTFAANASYGNFAAKYPGALGSALKISICDSANAYSSTIYGMANAFATLTFTVGSNVATLVVSNTAGKEFTNNLVYSFANSFITGDYIVAGNSQTIGTQFLKISNTFPTNLSLWTIVTGGNATTNATLTANLETYYSLATSSTLTANNSNATNMTSNITRYWEFYNTVNKAPGTSSWVSARGGNSDEVHVVVVDNTGKISGVSGTILETYNSLSRAIDAYGPQGGSSYYPSVLNNSSNWVWYLNTPTGMNHVGNTSATVTAANSSVLPKTFAFTGGVDSLPEGGTGGATNMSMADLTAGYDLFKSAEDIDISLLLAGKAAGVNYVQVANYLIDNIAETRKDCVVFISPNYESVIGTTQEPSDSVVSFRNNIHSSSYAVIDSGYKYFYDRYNDQYIYVPLNGDVAGAVVRTDNVRDPWFSPAGFNRGQIKNVIKLPFNPNKAQRDNLYKNDINPIVNFPGQGVILFGDKTALGKPSAFDRINVRRLFIVLEKAIATAPKFTLFEFNDTFTRAQFRNLIEPFLRDIQGRRGIYDFKVICDETNNTPERIDRNEFWGDIYIKPARSINFIQLNFVAVRTGVEFEEVIGQF